MTKYVCFAILTIVYFLSPIPTEAIENRTNLVPPSSEQIEFDQVTGAWSGDYNGLYTVSGFAKNTGANKVTFVLTLHLLDESGQTLYTSKGKPLHLTPYQLNGFKEKAYIKVTDKPLLPHTVVVTAEEVAQ